VLPASQRLTSPTQFREAVRRGRRSGGRLLVAHLLLPGPDSHERAPEHGPRVGLVVSKAVGNAVTRNLVKRRLRHLSRERLARLPGDTLLVLRALPAAAEASYAELGADLDRCLERGLTPRLSGSSA
jgi:ribonuclease P protein component